MKVERLSLEGPRLIRPKVWADERGFFLESYSEARYREHGVSCPFVQDNHSCSKRGTLRGLHYQSVPGQAKLVRVVRGRIFDAVVDIRPESSTFGQWLGVELDADEHLQLFVPVGFAHGFCVLSEEAEVLYKVSSPYHPETECGIAWNDPDIGVDWPVPSPVLSRRDETNESFAAFRARVTP